LPDHDLKPPEHEIKLLIPPLLALSADGLRHEIVDAFSLDSHAEDMSMLFVDDQALHFNTRGWNVRLRRNSTRNAGELTFKMRYPVEAAGLDAAWAVAREDGITRSKDYEPQVEWNYTRKTISFSRNAKFDALDAVLDLPGRDHAVAIVQDRLPDRLGDLKPLLENASIFGPVYGRRWSGTWSAGRGSDEPIRIEHWEIPNARTNTVTSVVEASIVVKDEGYFAALDIHAGLARELCKRGWLEKADSLKTRLVLEAFSNPTENLTPAST
jgi:hypothetical protein